MTEKEEDQPQGHRPLSELQAYEAMFCFLEGTYDRTKSDAIGSLLGDMSILEDGGTADPAAWKDWRKAVDKALEGKADLDLGLD